MILTEPKQISLATENIDLHSLKFCMIQVILQKGISTMHNKKYQLFETVISQT